MDCTGTCSVPLQKEPTCRFSAGAVHWQALHPTMSPRAQAQLGLGEGEPVLAAYPSRGTILPSSHSEWQFPEGASDVDIGEGLPADTALDWTNSCPSIPRRHIKKQIRARPPCSHMSRREKLSPEPTTLTHIPNHTQSAPVARCRQQRPPLADLQLRSRFFVSLCHTEGALAVGRATLGAGDSTRGTALLQGAQTGLQPANAAATDVSGYQAATPVQQSAVE
ncbi:hypothetical protein QBC40DRAFT_331250 [Triangularia verruculosa]|uniref:Uncharacterized protein n=1 Tax=Triangularia verruculosa TaxID=2587418 RepID=A0AAN6XH36_9PEZI|nr:hypothetical protein QBC40DRAFT_331250 [Triangularia verruculosa]